VLGRSFTIIFAFLGWSGNYLRGQLHYISEFMLEETDREEQMPREAAGH